jgi:hypothetical protein
MQKHHINVTERIELTSPISAKGDQGQRNPVRAAATSGRRSRSPKYVLQQDVNQLSPPGANFTATSASLVLQAQSMLLNLQELLVKRENFGWTSGSCRREATCSMRQNLLQVTGRFHHEFRSLLNLKSEAQNPNLISDGEQAIRQGRAISFATSRHRSRFSISEMK